MKLFIDTGSVAEAEEIAGWGVLSGATTNPSLLAKEDGDPGESIRRICELVDGPGIERFTADWQSRPEFADWLHGLVRSGVPAQ